MSLTAITDTLTHRHLLRHPWLFRGFARLTGQDRHLHAGRYSLPAGLAPRDLLARLVAGHTIPVAVTLPEGLSAGETAELVATALNFSPNHFLAAADSVARAGIAARDLMGSPPLLAHYDSLLSTTMPDVPRRLHWSEGYLAPDTYHFAEGTTARRAAATIVELGLARADSCGRFLAGDTSQLGLTPHQVVTLASLVEAEARLAAERPLIAAVYVNRLRRGWRLEADPCIAYLLEKKGQRLYYRDLEVASPYNTYRQKGLPPGPIGNPGLPSLQAAAHPDPACEALFFVSDGEGGHVFSRTSAEHERAVQRYRGRRRAGSR
jgi:UPF0755 protein